MTGEAAMKPGSGALAHLPRRGSAAHFKRDSKSVMTVIHFAGFTGSQSSEHVAGQSRASSFSKLPSPQAPAMATGEAAMKATTIPGMVDAESFMLFTTAYFNP